MTLLFLKTMLKWLPSKPEVSKSEMKMFLKNIVLKHKISLQMQLKANLTTMQPP